MGVTILLLGATAAQAGGPPKGIWLTPAEVKALPASGAAYTAVLNTANGTWGAHNVQNLGTSGDVDTLAGALIAVRNDNAALTTKVQSALAAVIGTDTGSPHRTLEYCRNTLSYVLAADLIGYSNPSFDSWLTRSLNDTSMFDLGTSLHNSPKGVAQDEPSNWGTACRATRLAIDLYLGDSADVAESARIFQGWLGDRATYAFPAKSANGVTRWRSSDGTLAWEPDPSAPVPVLPVGARLAATGTLDLSGAQPQEMTRGGAPKRPPSQTDYPWASLQTAIPEADMLARAGYTAYAWSTQAVLRTIEFNKRLKDTEGWAFPQHPAYCNLLAIVDKRYATTFKAQSSCPAVSGKGQSMAWTDWTHH